MGFVARRGSSVYYPNLARRSDGRKCVYRFSMDRLLCPVMVETSIMLNPFSNKREVASCLRSCRVRPLIPHATQATAKAALMLSRWIFTMRPWASNGRVRMAATARVDKGTTLEVPFLVSCR
jgi:hypothetical protein